MSLTTLTLVGMLFAAGQGQDDIKAINHRNIQIPLKFVAGRRNEVRELLLFVSRNQGQSWEQEAIATPDKDAFPFFAPADGVYWFQVMIVDKKGGRDPADVYNTAPGLKVLVDTTSPIMRLTPGERVGDEVSVGWEIQEPYADLKSFRLEYATFGADGAPVWRMIQATPGLSGNARFRPIASGPMRVRMTLLDQAGNRGELVKDLPNGGGGNVAFSPMNPPAMNPAPLLNPAPMNNPAPLLNPSPVQQTSLNNPSSNNPTGLVLPPDLPSPTPMQQAPMTIGASDLPLNPPMITPRQQPTPTPIQQPAPTPTEIGQPESMTNPLAVSNNQNSPAPANTLPAPQTVNVLDFDLAYNVEQVGPSGVARAELWVTRDDGKTWIKWSEDEDRKSPIAVSLNTGKNPQIEGLYGFKVVLQSGAGLSKGPPISGDSPDLRIDVDVTAPIVKIYNPIPDANQRDILTIRWEAVDRNMPGESITLEWSEMPDGPWRPVVTGQANPVVNQNQLGVSSNAYGTAQNVANTGSYPWKLPANMPTHRVYLRISAHDAAGNVAVAKTPQPIEVDLNKPVAKIQGIVGTTPRRN